MPEAVTTRAALLPAAGTPLRVVELELAPPGPGEVRVRLHASGVCSDDLNAIDGSVEIPCPVVPGHEGAGRGGGDRGGRARPRAGRPRRPLVGALLRHLRAVPARPAPPVRDGMAAHAGGRHARRHDAALVRRRDGAPLLLPLVVRRAGGRSRALVRPHPRGGAVRGGGAGRLRGHVGRRVRCGGRPACGPTSASPSSASAARGCRRSSARWSPVRRRSWRSTRAPSGSSVPARRGRPRPSCSTARPRPSRRRSSRRAAAGSTTRSSRAGGRRRCGRRSSRPGPAVRSS